MRWWVRELIRFALPGMDRELVALQDRMEQCRIEAGISSHVFSTIRLIEQNRNVNEWTRRILVRNAICDHIRRTGGKPDDMIVDALVALARVRLVEEAVRKP